MSVHLHSEILESTGKPLIMLHGWGHTSEKLRPMALLLRKSSQPHLIDLPGFGKSSLPPENWSAFDYAHKINEYLDSQGIVNCNIMGHSFGGKVAMSFAITYPDKVDKLILMSTSGLRRRRSFLDHCRMLAIKVTGFTCKKIDALLHTHLYTNSFIPSFGSTDYKNAGAMRKILVKTVSEDYTRLLHQIKAETMILWGEEDQETPQEMAHKLNKNIKKSSLVVLPYKSHEPFNDTGSHLCAHYISHFLEKGCIFYD